MSASSDRHASEQHSIDTQEQLAIFSALANAYSNVYLIRIATGEAKVLKLNGYITTGISTDNDKVYDYATAQRQYVSERVHPDDKDMMYEAISLKQIKKHLAAGSEYCGNYRVLSNGETHNYQFKYVKPEGPDYIVAAFQNVDGIIEQHLAEEKKERGREEAYREELEKQLAIFDILSHDYRNVYLANVNDGSAKILKIAGDYDAEDLQKLKDKVFAYEPIIERWIEQRVHSDDRARLARALSTENMRAILATQDEYTETYRSLDGGKMHNYQLYVAKLNDSGDVIAAFQFVDKIIEKHLAQERELQAKENAYKRKLLAAKRDAERANRAKTDFLLRMSHDIRTPLNGIMGMLDIAERCQGDIAKRDDCRVKIHESAQLLLELVNEVLDMNKLESGNVVLEHVPFDLTEISRNVAIVIAKQAESRGIELVEVDCDAPHRWLMGSPVHFKRIMTNILSNAIKYNKDKGRIYITCKELSCQNGIARIEFKCRDEGVGMSPEFLERIFEPFAQEDRTTHSEYGGTGLGMSITKGLVDKMGGTISVESTKGEGTCIDMIVPLEIADEPAAVQGAGEGPSASIEGLNILLVEDNDLNMEIARFLLKEAGASIIEAANGREAVDAFAASAPFSIDAVLMDVMMPVMNGLKATKRIRRMDRPDADQVPIIAMTASAFTEDRVAAKKAGMNEHLAKPLDTKLLIGTIAYCVRKRGKAHAAS